MNKQELIKHFEELPYVSIHQMGKKSFIDLIEKLDEPQKTVVPQFVADYIESAKKQGDSLRNAMLERVIPKQAIKDWIRKREGGEYINQNTFALAWVNGYTVEKEKRYLVKMKGMASNFRFLKYNFTSKNCYMGNDSEIQHARLYHTRKELEDAGFGWVFDCPGIEVEEVEE